MTEIRGAMVGPSKGEADGSAGGLKGAASPPRRPLRVLDLFSGIGGFSLGLERTGGFETVAFCEIEPFPRKVLAKHWPGVPIYDDVRTMPRLGAIDVVCGGFPCQPFSSAGKREGKGDDRHLWPAMLGVIDRERPAWVIGENVAGLESVALEQVVSELEACGYEVATFEIPACAVGHDHLRKRLWIIGHADNCGQPNGALDDEAPGLPACDRPVAGSDRSKNGLSSRVDRLRALGNAVVPQIPELIGRAILQSMEVQP